MKKIIVLLIVVSFASAGSISLSLNASWMIKKDSNFKEIYGSGGFSPGLKVEFKATENIVVYGGYDYFSRTGTTPVFKEKAKTTHNYMSFGLGYEGKISKRMSWGLSAGFLYVNYREEALEETVKDSAYGFQVEGCLTYNFAEHFLMRTYISYLRANDEVEGVSVKLGGIKAGAGIGVRF